jgi:hypothetical protein
MGCRFLRKDDDLRTFEHRIRRLEHEQQHQKAEFLSLDMTNPRHPNQTVGSTHNQTVAQFHYGRVSYFLCMKSTGKKDGISLAW